MASVGSIAITGWAVPSALKAGAKLIQSAHTWCSVLSQRLATRTSVSASVPIPKQELD